MITVRVPAPRRAWPVEPERKLRDGSAMQEFQGADGKRYYRIQLRPDRVPAGGFPVVWEQVVC